MQTSDLIESLAADLRPVPKRVATTRLVLGAGAGAMVALAATWGLLGLRIDSLTAVLDTIVWMKWAYALSLSVLAIALCRRLARPEGAPGVLPAMLIVPFVALGALGLYEISSVPDADRHALWLGHSALRCPWIIAGLALPVFAGVLWAFRQLAPTRQRLAGFAAGLLAGSVAAFVYAFHCNESAAAFVGSWYTAGILLPALLGAIIGPRVLRW